MGRSCTPKAYRNDRNGMCQTQAQLDGQTLELSTRCDNVQLHLGPDAIHTQLKMQQDQSSYIYPATVVPTGVDRLQRGMNVTSWTVPLQHQESFLPECMIALLEMCYYR